MDFLKLAKKVYRHCRAKLITLIKERTFAERVKYIHFKRGSDDLIIVFSAFGGEVPQYNYMSSLQTSKRDLLFIKDNFGYKGSYYMYENGDNTPEQLVSRLIEKIIAWGGYKHIYTVGSSKGGTSAIYFGLKHNAKEVFAGACQYYIGSYLNKDAHKRILKMMLGADFSQADVEMLDAIMPSHIRRHRGSQTLIHLLYSKNEHTYAEHIKDLIEDLQNNDIRTMQYIETFDNHNDVFKTFIPLIKQKL